MVLKTGEKSVSIKVSEELKTAFDIATKARHEKIQNVVLRAIQAYIDETTELEKQGLIKIFGRS